MYEPHTTPQNRFLFGTNLKMHQTPAETRQFVGDIHRLLGTPPEAQLFVIPPFTSLPGLASVVAGTGMWIGAQNMHWAPQGAYTGEISPAMLRAIDVDLILLGHAERRGYFHETDEALRKKARAACEHGLRVLLCVGETAEERGYNCTDEVLGRQLKIALHDFPAASLPELLIAYEPVWAIGEGGQPATPEAVALAMDHIRAVMGSLYGEAGRAVPVLYGGSVSAENCGDYARLGQVDGLFVGRSAWYAEGYVNVLRTALKARRERTG